MADYARALAGVDRGALGYLVAAWLVSAATHVYVIAPASVLPRVADGLGVPETTAVWLVSAVLAAWAATNAGVGVVIDRVGDHAVVAVGGGLVVAAGLAGTPLARQGAFLPLLATRAVAGAGLGAAWIASATLVGRVFAAEHRGTAQGIFTTSAPAGFAVGQFGAPVVDAQLGWQAVFAVGGVATGLALACYGVVHLRAGEGGGVGAATADGSTRGNYLAALRSPTVLAGCGLAFVSYSLYLFLNSWLPTYLVREFAVPLGLSGLLAATFPAVGVVSRAGGGVLSDRLLGRRRLPVLRLSILVATPVVGLLWLADSIPVMVVLLLVGGAVIQLTFGVVYSYVQEGVDPAVAGTALSLLGTAGIAGAFSAPVVAGALIDLTGGYAGAFGYAVALGGLGLVVGFAVAPVDSA